MKTGRLHISIPNACSEDYSKMESEGNNRHCAKCDHIVHDFSQMTDAALFRFFSSHTGKVCGKFADAQLDRDLFLPDIKQHLLKKYWKIAASALTFFLAKPDESRGTAIIHTTQNPVAKTPTAAFSDTLVFKGRILDKDNHPVNGAEVVLKTDEGLQRVFSDSTGNFQITHEGKPGMESTLTFTYYDQKKIIVIASGVKSGYSDMNIKLETGTFSCAANGLQGRVGGAVAGITITTSPASPPGRSIFDILRNL